LKIEDLWNSANLNLTCLLFFDPGKNGSKFFAFNDCHLKIRCSKEE